MLVLRCTIAAIFLGLASPAPAAERSSLPAPGDEIAREHLVRALQRGGLTLYFRHTATDFSQADRDDERLADCTRQRNLTEAGRRDARAVGEAMRRLELPIGEVLASPYCRTLETARLLAGSARATREVRGRMTATGAPDYSALEKILATPPSPGTLRIVAGHGNPFIALAGPPRLEEGEAAVIRGDGARWTVVARIKVGDWESIRVARE